MESRQAARLAEPQGKDGLALKLCLAIDVWLAEADLKRFARVGNKGRGIHASWGQWCCAWHLSRTDTHSTDGCSSSGAVEFKRLANGLVRTGAYSSRQQCVALVLRKRAAREAWNTRTVSETLRDVLKERYLFGDKLPNTILDLKLRLYY